MSKKAVIKNLTSRPTTVVCRDENGNEEFLTIYPDPIGPFYARYFEVIDGRMDVGDGFFVDVVRREYLPLSNFPEEEEGVYYIVSTPVGSHPDFVDRNDLIISDKVIKNERGTIVGCAAFRIGKTYEKI